MTSSIRRNPIVRVVAVLALAFGLFAAVPTASGAVEACTISEYGNTMQLAPTPSTVQPGTTVVINGSGYPPNCILGVSVGACGAANTIGNVTTDENGNFSINWAVPADQKPGDVLICTSIDSVEVTANVMVQTQSQPTVPGATGGGGQGGQGGTGGQGGILPKTGSQVLPFIGAGVLLLVVGSMLVLSSRKRNATH